MTTQEHQYATYWGALVDYLPCGVLILNPKGVVEYANLSLEKTLGFNQGGLDGLNASAFFHSQDRTTLDTLMERQSMESSWKVVARLRRRDDAWRLFEIRGRILATGPSSAPYLLLTLRDITVERRAEAILKRRNLELALLNQAGRAFSASLDLDHVLATVLEEVRRLMGVVACSIWLVDQEMDELVCRQATGTKKDLVQGWRLPMGEGLVGLAATTGKSLNIPDVLENEQHFVGIDEETGLALRSILSVPLKAKEDVIGVIQALDTQVDRFTDSDVTLLAALGASAASAIDNARLVAALRQRTADLKASNRELEAFAHTVAHDLKAPITHVIGYADVLIEYDDLTEENQRDYIQAIWRSSRKMNNIIDELLLLAELRKEDIVLSPLNMGRIVREALQRLQPMCEQKEAEIRLAEEWPSASGYAPWGEEVWVNHISTGLNYGGEPACIELGAQVNDASVAYWVRDNGAGLLAQEQKRLFVPFTHVGEVDTKGYGLGLSIVYRIVEKLNGDVWVKSAKGKGSLFGFTLQKASDAG